MSEGEIKKVLSVAGIEDKCSDVLEFLSQVKVWNKGMRIVGSADDDSLVNVHLADSIALLAELDRGKDIADLGSGAGFPGVILAISGFFESVWLVERSEKRRAFLEFIVRKLNLSAEVVEDVSELGKNVKVVVSRGVGGFDKIRKILKKSGSEFVGEVWIYRGNEKNAYEEIAVRREGWIGEVIQKRVVSRDVYLVKFSRLRW